MVIPSYTHPLTKEQDSQDMGCGCRDKAWSQAAINLSLYNVCMYIDMYICLYVNMYVYIYIFIFIFVYTHTYDVCVSIYIYVYIYIHMYVCTYARTYMYASQWNSTSFANHRNVLAGISGAVPGPEIESQEAEVQPQLGMRSSAWWYTYPSEKY